MKLYKKITYGISIFIISFCLTSLFLNEVNREIKVNISDIVITTYENDCLKPNKKYQNMFWANVNPQNSLPDKTYIPYNLVELSNTTSAKEGICLTKQTRKALREMISVAKKDNLTIKATSAFRSYQYQDSILSNAQKYRDDAEKFIAKPGHSEHQLGTAVDLSGLSIGYSSAVSDFKNTIEHKWLKENSQKFGFTMSYPKGKEFITGYGYEPWHYRYVGINAAKYIKENNITLTEYLTSHR
ncbi:MAG: M15 family metallopeptidase [Patescibacteria group bacterium]|nr:M15 family metallopeptidase [Patescibacteria group bacterium]